MKLCLPRNNVKEMGLQVTYHLHNIFTLITLLLLLPPRYCGGAYFLQMHPSYPYATAEITPISLRQTRAIPPIKQKAEK